MANGLLFFDSECSDFLLARYGVPYKLQISEKRMKEKKSKTLYFFKIQDINTTYTIIN